MKIKAFTDTSSLSLADLMSPYDPQQRGMIAKSDVPKAFAKIGIVNMSDSELNQLFRTGGIKPEEANIDYQSFSAKLMKTITYDINAKV